jgi:stage II sporulation protein D
VGMCQWGAVGRARAGQSYDRILAAYYPGTRLERLY